MKALAWSSIGALLAPCASAALLAHIATDLGTITVELQFGTAPQAVANFKTLAEGSRTRVDPITGAVTNDPLYIGEKFFRTANSASFKFAQTGSGSGDNSGNSGFTFKDEFDPAVRHTGYTLSSANAGPNTNGGQIFITGNVAIPQYDDVHTIIGLIPDPASRTVVDNVIAAGDNGSMITGMTFERTDPAAVAFDEMAQNLPTVTVPPGNLVVSKGQFTRYNLLPAATTGDVIHGSRSGDLGSWTKVVNRHVGIEPPLLTPALPFVDLDGATANRGFYHVAIAHHPGAVAPSHLRNRTVLLQLTGATFEFAFDATGNAGTATYTASGSAPIPGNFSNFDFGSSAHEVYFIADTNFSPRYFFIKAGCDSATNTLISGHHVTQYYNNGWLPFDNGNFTITR